MYLAIANPSASLAPPEEHSSPVRRLNRSAAALIRTDPQTCSLGRYGLVEKLATGCGFEGQLVILRVGYKDHPLTIVGVPTWIWRCPERMAVLHELKRVIAFIKRKVILVPEGFFLRQLRLQNARALAEAIVTPSRNTLDLQRSAMRLGQTPFNVAPAAHQNPSPIEPDFVP